KPTVPTDVQASFVGANLLRLSWSASTDNVGVTKYEVFRGTALVGISTTTSILVNGLSPGSSYSLRVRAGDDAGNWSDPSEPLEVTTGPLLVGGGAHSLSVRADGTVWGWGQNSSGQLGDGATTDRITPVLSGLTN